ncbi:Hpt domain-containing protein [Zavarzinia sp. CC-PAN008]|uniref:Hpt domain-containing protein n=1 Tax=Zavarzinia sp. CC-PAN008 TaxID=3243332 RepID=UPI003F747BBB
MGDRLDAIQIDEAQLALIDLEDPLLGLPLLDEGTIVALVLMIGAPKVSELLQLLLDEGASCCRRLHDIDDPVDIKALAHGLKGAAGNMGARALMAAARVLERDAFDRLRRPYLVDLVARVYDRTALAGRLRLAALAEEATPVGA